MRFSMGDLQNPIHNLFEKKLISFKCGCSSKGFSVKYFFSASQQMFEEYLHQCAQVIYDELHNISVLNKTPIKKNEISERIKNYFEKAFVFYIEQLRLAAIGYVLSGEISDNEIQLYKEKSNKLIESLCGRFEAGNIKYQQAVDNDNSRAKSAKQRAFWGFIGVIVGVVGADTIKSLLIFCIQPIKNVLLTVGGIFVQ